MGSERSDKSERRVLIAHIAHWEELLGGAEYQLKMLSDLLRAEDFEVHVVYPRRVAGLRVSDPAVCHALVNQKPKRLFGKVWFFNFFDLWKKFRSVQPDVVVTRTYSSWAGIAAIACKVMNIRHVHFIASDSDVTKKNARLIKPFDFVEDFFYRNVFFWGSHVVCQNEFQKRRLKQSFKSDAQLVLQKGLFVEATELDKAGPVVRVVWVGNMKPIKQPELFVELASQFSERSDVEFIAIGGYTDERYSRLMEKACRQDNFHYYGQLDNSEVNAILTRAHVVVNTSEFEGFSNTFVQAWLREVVVLSLNSNPSAILTRTKHSKLTGTMEKMELELTRMLDDKQRLKEMGENARNYALTNHLLDERFLVDVGISKC